MNNIIPCVSVIVAVYKAEKYVARCIDSLLQQTLKDIEIILVDDGSPDKSGEICEMFKKLDSRIIVIHKENGGVSSARQVGIERATGLYTIHVDPDDWIEKEMLAEMYNVAIKNNSDIIISDFVYETPDKSYVVRSTGENTLKTMYIKETVCGYVSVSLCNKLIRRKFYNCSQVNFCPGYNYWEDYYINSVISLENPKVYYINKAFYHVDRYSNSNSLSREYNKKEIDCLLYYQQQIEKKLKNYNMSEELVVGSKCFVKFQILNRFCSLLSRNDYNRLFPELLNSPFLETYSRYFPKYFFISIKGWYLYAAFLVAKEKLWRITKRRIRVFLGKLFL